ncbi:hypothetical protein SCHPADRAFT_469262 [Schizopora paradoxa]|uniref:Uncharacterized protein n=1 Tax=Schizopora paradoxa TaxID=27342 RepID=A0A0H2RHS8_9AGAM|nr:hypothetical protein SCHPADRAFT_469262 [Schizopora paradoxa]
MAPISKALAKALPASARRSAKAHLRSRPASTLTLSGSGDIFDAPERPFEDGQPEQSSSFMSALQHRYFPSPFCPPANYSYSPSSSSSSSASLSSWAASRSAGPSGTATHTPSLLLDGPARPRQRLVVTSRNRHSSSSATVKPLLYVPAIPEIFDGPARPRRRAPSQNSKNEVC